MNKEAILITGGSDGLGKELARILAPDYQVVVLARNKEKTESVAKELGVDFVVADISKVEDIERAVSEVIKKYGKIFCLVNNAGIWVEGQLDSHSPEEIKKVFDINTLGTILMTREVIPFMKKEGKGKILNVVSQGGLSVSEERSIYYSSKWAITGFTKCLEADLRPFGISVSGFYPAKINTKIFEKFGSEKDMSNAMDPKKVAETMRMIIESPDGVEIMDVGVRHL